MGILFSSPNIFLVFLLFSSPPPTKYFPPFFLRSLSHKSKCYEVLSPASPFSNLAGLAGRWCKIVQDGARWCKIVQYHAIPSNTMQYHATAKPCHTMQYH